MNIGAGHLNRNGTEYSVVITDSQITDITSTTFSLYLRSEGFKIRWTGASDPYDPVKASTCKARIVVNNSSQESTLLTPFTNPTTNHYMYIFKGESTLLWKGFIAPKLAAINQTGYPKTITIEAIDRLAMLKERNLWDTTKMKWNTSINQANFIKFNDREFDPGTSLVDPTEDITFRMGEPYSGVGSLSPSKRFPNFIEMLFSLLMDIDRDTTIDQIYVVEHYNFNQTDTRLTGGLANTTTDVNQYKYADFPSTKEKASASVADLIREACLLFNMRCYQWLGRYYFIQNEIYQHANSVGYYRYGWGTATGEQPVDIANGTWTTSDYRQQVYSSTSASWPKLEGGTIDEYDIALKKAQLLYKKGSTSTTLANWVLSTTSTQNTVNVHRFSQPVANIGPVDFYDGGISVYRAVPASNAPIVTRRDADNVAQDYNLWQHCVMAQFEARSDINRVLQVKLIDDDTYDPAKAITYSTVEWIWTNLSWDSEKDVWTGRFYEMNADTSNSSGYSELVNETA